MDLIETNVVSSMRSAIEKRNWELVTKVRISQRRMKEWAWSSRQRGEEITWERASDSKIG